MKIRKFIFQEEEIDLFDNFIATFALEDYPLDFNIEYYVNSSGTDPFSYISKVIYYNRDFCNALSLTERERYAFIAHEIGHAVDKTEGHGTEEREINADDFAIHLGLADELLSGLRKLISCGKMTKQEIESLESRTNRIQCLKEATSDSAKLQ